MSQQATQTAFHLSVKEELKRPAAKGLSDSNKIYVWDKYLKDLRPNTIMVHLTMDTKGRDYPEYVKTQKL